MKIIGIVEQPVSIASSIGNAFIWFDRMDVSVVAVISDQVRDGERLIGYGFNSNGRYAPSGLLHARFIPRLREADPGELVDADRSNFSPHRAWDVMMRAEKPGGHGERSVAVGTLDMAMWDLRAKVAGAPLQDLLAAEHGSGSPEEDVFVYAAGGYYQPGKGVDELQDEMRGYLDRGFTVTKMKVGGVPLADDLRRIEAVLDVVGDPAALCVDANGRFDTAEAVAFGEAIASYGLRWYEEPGDPLDYELHAEVARRYEPPLATGENLFSTVDARNLIRYGGLRPDRDVLQFDCALSYGLVEYLRTLRMLADHGWSWRRCLPHGGHQLSLCIAAGLGLGGNEAYPEVFEPFGRFPDDAQVVDGRITLPRVPGIGWEANGPLYDVLRSVHD